MSDARVGAVRHIITATFMLALVLVAAAAARAGEAATLVFRSGQVVYLDNGYGAIVAAMSKLNHDSQAHNIVDLNIGGGSFLLNVAEVVIVCRDNCPSLTVQDMRDPARGPAR